VSDWASDSRGFFIKIFDVTTIIAGEGCGDWLGKHIREIDSDPLAGKFQLGGEMSSDRTAKREEILIRERRQLARWCKLTDRVELKKAIRAEIAIIDDELRQLNGRKSSLIAWAN